MSAVNVRIGFVPSYRFGPTDDVYHGAYLVGLLRGWSLRDVAIFASAAAALKCARLGGRAGIPSLAQTLTFLKDHHIDLPAV